MNISTKKCQCTIPLPNVHVSVRVRGKNKQVYLNMGLLLTVVVKRATTTSTGDILAALRYTSLRSRQTLCQAVEARNAMPGRRIA